jgi:Nucleotidyl transferase AbiEii toxin, Type IV TA system
VKSEVLPESTKSLFEKFENSDLPPKSYLGGGTAIALHIGHRQSVDLDWFTQSKFDEKVWQMKWETRWNFNMQLRDWQTLVGEIAGVKTSLYFYKYPLIGDLVTHHGLQIASIKDLAAMKLDAVISRGTKRDFIDLYFLAKEYGPELMLDFYDEKYGNLGERELLIRKALVYFKEADEDEMPKMLLPIEWKEVKEFFVKTFI